VQTAPQAVTIPLSQTFPNFQIQIITKLEETSPTSNPYDDAATKVAKFAY
jgi:hypothetical protein